MAFQSGVYGRVSDRATGLGFANVLVLWTVTDTSVSTILGSARTTADGSFSIGLLDTAEAGDAACRLQHHPEWTTQVAAATDDGSPFGQPVTVQPGQPETTIALPEDAAPPSTADWQAMAAWLNSNRALRMSDFAGQLLNPSAGNPASDWTAPMRASALRQILDAFANEEAALADAMSLLYDNSYVSTAALAQGDVRTAVTFFRQPQNVLDMLNRFGTLFPQMPESNLALYRDYLRGIWVLSAQKMYWDEASFTAAPLAKLEQQLDNRFHQNFHTNSMTDAPTAHLLIPILLSILVGGPETGGFNLAAAAIPAQGAQTDEQYLAALIALSGKSAEELRARFRVSLDRDPGATTNPVQLNVEALLGLLTDTWQSPVEPFNPLPVIAGNGFPLIFGRYAGRAPFFLEYEEWLARQQFFPENIYNIRTAIPVFGESYTVDMPKEKAGVAKLYGMPDYYDNQADLTASIVWIERYLNSSTGLVGLPTFGISAAFNAALASFDAQNYPDAADKLDAAAKLVSDAIYVYAKKWIHDRFDWPGFSSTKDERSVSLKDRANLAIKTIPDLRKFEAFFTPVSFPTFDLEGDQADIARTRTVLLYNAFYLFYVLAPYFRAAIYAAQSDYANAILNLAPLTGYEAGIAETARPDPYWIGIDAPFGGAGMPRFYHDATLPYTIGVGFDEQFLYAELQPTFAAPGTDLGIAFNRLAVAPFEIEMFEIAQADAMLAWADELFRNDDPSSIRRARELYKGVIFLHGEDPEIAPQFRSGGPRPVGLGAKFGDITSLQYQQNPAVVAQIQRARQGLYFIEEGLNAYGYRDDMVPYLRYKPLKTAADLFAASAKSAQNDFLMYQAQYEQAELDSFRVRNLLQRAQAGAGIANEQIEIAKAGVQKAQDQVTAVQAQIAAKQAEIADEGSFFNQVKDFFGGVKDSLGGLVSAAKKTMTDDSAAGVASSDQLGDIFSAGVSGGGDAAKSAALETLGSGAGMAIGIGAFAYVSYTTMSSMADTFQKRASELTGLEGSLAAAQAQVRLKQRDVTIAQYNQQIAQADLDYAQMLQRFQEDRFLNADFWRKMAQFANQLMRRYVELGARTAWQAERALAFEQDRSIHIIRMNYLPSQMRGVTGADSLQADLAELEANRIQGVRLTTPVKHTISLARGFPVQFGQLKNTGACRLHTQEASLRAAYPGTFAYRIRAVTVAAYTPDGPPPRGILRNQGFSQVSHEDLSGADTLMRFPDALALSEFRLHDDLFVYGLPGETLMQFEGSGYETDWELLFPPAANPSGLRSLADVLITFDMNARYSQDLAVKLAGAPPAPVSRSILMLASVWDARGLKTLQTAPPAPARITFDPSRLALPAQESGRKVAQLALLCVGATPSNYNATLTAKSGTSAAFTLENGMALSNAGPLLGLNPALPLNALIGQDVLQPFVLEIDKAGVTEELTRLFDVALYLEYAATLA